jgi:hypothetical protein
MHEQVFSIRNKIINKVDRYFKLYVEIYNKANESGTSVSLKLFYNFALPKSINKLNSFKKNKIG